MPTRRQEIIQMLEHGQMSLYQIAGYFKVELFEIEEDLEHIQVSIRPRKLKRIPSQCKQCHFVFKERTKFRTPTKCPKCRSEWITDAMFYVE
ncbi:transcriptional regulator [Candidatus Woesearchaeota archaeon]|nr:transcriptional regulator [Candidatus Woesearchaeota archaeon]